MQHAVGGTHLRERPIVLSVALFLLLTLLVIVPASPARAATFAVDSTADVAGSGDLTDGTCDDGGGNCTLRAAVQEANGTAGADDITLSAATYTLSLGAPGEDVAATGDLDITSNVTINGAPGGTTIDANSIDRVFHVLSGASLTLNDVTITGGAAATGAGIRVNAGATLTINNSTLTGNTATGHGGAIYAAGDVTADLVTISGNSAGTTAGDGGGLYSAGGTHTLDSTTVAFNDADNGGGLAQSAGTVTIGHTILSNNTAGAGNQCSGTVGTSDYNVIAAIGPCTFSPAANDSTGTAAGLVALADNGGPTETHALNGTSVALDVGGTCSAADQRGITRGASCDAGAFEAIQVEFNAAIASRAESVGTYNVAVTIDGSNPYAATNVTVGQTGGTATLGTDYTLSNTNISFPAGTTASQSATVTITDDDFGEGDETAIFGLSGATGAVLGGTDTHTLTITDNEAVGITLTPTSLTVEEGASDSYQIVLDSEPTADVLVTFNDGTEADAGFGSVTFTSVNWDVARNVVVSVPDNAVADGTRADAITHSVTSSDGDYAGLDPTLPVSITDDDGVSITVAETGGTTAVSEATPGVTDSYSVVLGSAPVGTVTITPSFDSSQVLVTPASRSFTAADYDTSKNFTVTVVDDDVDEAPTHVSTITHSVTAGSDPAYSAITPDPVAVDITDDDVPGITLTPTSLTVAENAFNSYQIVLDSEPTDDVVVVFNDGTEADAGFASVTFTSANWDVARNVVVSVPDNAVADGTRADSITHAVTSSDGDYDELNPTVSVTITDDDGQPEVDILDVTQAETDGVTTFTFDVSVSPLSTSPITITYSTVPAGIDPADPSEYESITNRQLIIPALTGTDTIDVDVNGDDLDEDQERFRVNLTGVTGGVAAASSQGLGYINDDDDSPIADNDTYNVDEGATLNVGIPGGVLNGDTDGDSGTLNAVIQAAPTDHVGIFTLTTNGSFTYENDGDDGPDTFTYRASDGSNLSALATVTINVANVDPTVSINENPGSGPEGTQIDLTSAVSDPGNDTISRSWAVTKNGGAFDTGTGPGFSFTPDDQGTYVVTVTANDGDGGTGSDSITVNVSNVAPTVSINENPVSGPEGTAIALTSAVSDPGDDVITRSWSVTKNGGAFDTGAGPGFSFTPDDNGTYVATVTANDGEGGTNSDSVTVNVTNVAPNVTINQNPGTGTEGTPIALTSSVTDPGSADTFTRSWSVTKNGGAFDTGTGFSYTLTPDDNGTYVVTVTAIDDDGGSNMDSITVVVSNADPTVSINESPGSGPEGTLIALTSTVSDPGDDTITRSWSVTKNAAAFDSGTGPGFSFTPDDDGTYVVTVIANDGEGGSDTDSITITGTNVDPTVSINENPGSVPEGTLVALTSTASDPGDDVIARSWTVTKGGVPFANDTGPSFSFTPDDDATYVVTVVATDGDGGTGSDNITITGTNVDPTVTIVQDPGTGPEGTLIALTSTVSDPGDDVITRSWSVTKNGAAFDSGNGPAFSFTPDDDGTYVVTVTANDGDGGSGVDSITINVTNLDPTVSIVGAPGSGPEGTQIDLTSTVSDPGNDTITRSWSVTKNGAAFDSDNGPAFSFAPDDNGTYVVTLVATDGDGGSDTDTATINVTNADPTVSIVGAPASGPEGTQIDLTSTVSDPGDDVITRSWSVTKNGAAFDSGNGPGFSFTPDDNGTYVVTLVASDGEGGSATDTATINVTNVDPTVSIVGAPASGPEGTQIDLTSTVSDPGTADVISRAWSVTKDGAPFATGNGAAYSFTPDDNATYVVTLIASDDDGGSDTDTATIDVTNVGPTVSIDGPATISSPEGTEVSLTATVNDPGNDAVTLIWTVTKNGGAFDGGTGLAFSFTPDDNATYVVTLDADDSEGGTDSDSMTVNATNVAPVVPPPAGDSIDEGDSFALSAPFTDAGQAETHTAVVNWGDGTTEDCSVSPNCDLTQTDGLSGTVTGTHLYDDDGPWTVTVTVSDGIGSDSGAATVNVANVAPVVLFPIDDTITEGDTYTFAGAFTDPGAGDSWSAEVNYGDGTEWQPLTLSGMTFALDHLYVDDGVFDVEVCVADDDQLVTTPHDDGTCPELPELPAKVTVDNAAPVLTMREDLDLAGDLTVTLTGATPTSFTDAGVDDTHAATVDWGDGSPVAAATVNGDDTITASYTYPIAGELPYTVRVTVEDNGGASHTGTFQVNVEDLDFDVDFVAPDSRNEGGSLSISGNFSDIDGTGTYDVIVDWGDGSAPESIPYTAAGPGSGTFTSGSHRYADDSNCVSAPGQCTILVIVDDLGSPLDQGSDSKTVTVVNKVPTTAIAGPTTSPEGTGFKLFGNPKDVFADTLSYEWTVTKDTGDGPAVFKTGTFKNIWFQPDDGCATCVYEATFVVTDDDGGVSDPGVWTVDVTNVKPDAQMLDEFGNTLPPVYDGGKEGATVSLQAVFTDPGAADTHTITWEAKLLDQVIDTGNEATFDFVAPDDGAYFVVLTVTDDDGGADTPGSPLITVSNAPPKITNLVTDPTPSVGTPVALNVFFTDAGAGDEHTVTVDWGDGSPVDSEADATSPTALSHTFAAGAHRAKICVADDDGAKKCKKIWYNAGASPAGTGADFNGDGIEDMAVGVPGENSGAGAVNVFYGSSSGPSLTGDKFYRQGTNGVLGTSESGDEFGATLAYGDFNGDGYDDLAIGAPGEKLGGKNNAGSVNVLYGSASGLNANGDQLWTQDSNSVADSSQKGDRFADSLAAGDFNGDGFADLAIGVPGEDIGGTSNAGRVQVLFGGPSKLVAGFSQSWHQGVKGVLDNKQGSDRFGSALVGGDFDRDGFWDLAIGVPGQAVGGKSKAGAVAVLPGAVLGLTAEDDQVWNQNKPGINDSAEAGDQYGLALASGDFDDDGFADLAVGIPLEGVGGLSAAGAVSVIYGTGTGLASDGDQFWNENTTDIFGAAEANDQFGFALAVGDAGNNGFDDLLVGIPNQALGGDAEAGVVALIRGGGSGLAAVGNQRWHEDRSGTPGKAQPGDHFGAAVAFADVTGDGRDDLMAGIPGQSFTPTDVGAVMMVKGHSTGGFTTSGSKWYHQNMSGVAGDGSETNDQFGAAL